MARPPGTPIVGSGDTDPIVLPVGDATETVTETVPAGWRLTGAACAVAGATATGSFDAAGNRVTGISIQSGLETICTFNDVKDNPALSLVKTASPSTYSTVGQSISYSYLVTNSGNVSLAGPVTVTDDKATVTCPAVNTVGNLNASLDPGESITCTASYSITQADLNSGSVTNVATAHAGGTNSNQDTETVTAVQTKTLSLVKSATPSTYSTGRSVDLLQLPGHQHRQRAARRPGHGDRRQGDGDLPGREHGRQPRQLPRSGRGGHLHRLVLDHAGRPEQRLGHERGEGACAAASTPTRTPRRSRAVQTKTLSLVKSATPSTYSTVGQSISYSYLVTNTGNVRLAGPVTVADDKATVTCPAVSTVGNDDSFLDPGEAVTCTASYTITQADLNSGSVTNVAKASAAGIDSNEDTETVTAVRNPALSLVKTASPSTYSTVGQSISYSYLVTNTGNVSLAGPVTVTDDKATVTCPAVSTVGNLNDSPRSG